MSTLMYLLVQVKLTQIISKFPKENNVIILREKKNVSRHNYTRINFVNIRSHNSLCSIMKLKVTDYLSLNFSLFALRTKSKYLSVVALEVHSD